MKMKNIFMTLLIVQAFFVIPALASEEEKRVVNVSCENFNNFLRMDSYTNKNNYLIEYLNEISKYTDWDYEIHNITQQSALNMLDTGEIDIIFQLQYSDEYTDRCLFSDIPCYVDYPVMFALSTNDELFYENFEDFDGIRVGMVEDTYLRSAFKEFAMQNNFESEVEYFYSIENRDRALQNREIDAVVAYDSNFNNDKKLLAKIDYIPTFFATSVNNKSLMDEINYAVKRIHMENPYYSAYIHEKYFKNLHGGMISYSKEEVEFIKNSGEITIIYDEDSKPLEWFNEKTGKYEGVYPDIVKLVEEKTGLKFKAVSDDFESDKVDIERIRDGEAMILASTFDTEILSNSYDVKFTYPYYTKEVSLVGKKYNQIDITKDINVAIVKNRLGTEQVVLGVYPNWNIISYDDIEECFKKLDIGEVDAIVVEPVVIQATDLMTRYKNTIFLSMNSIEVPISFGIAKEEPDELISIIDKAVQKITYHEIQQCVLSNSIESKADLNLKMLIEDYPFYFVFITMFIVGLTMLSFVLIYKNKIKGEKNKILEEKNEQLKTAYEKELMLVNQVRKDPLTGLVNKKTMDNECKEYISNNSDCALMMIDIDNFKDINDTYGHQYGDEVLKSIAEGLRDVCGENIVGRIGGDEFLVLVKNNMKFEEIFVLAKQMCMKVSSIHGNEHTKKVSCSIGISVKKDSSQTYYSLFSNADEAMYYAKKNGKNNYCYYDDIVKT